ncbi:MAG: ATP-binding protein [Proteobacteria bacterium]|nr:ATP-binding protein [Pseudomonadota bacterium]
MHSMEEGINNRLLSVSVATSHIITKPPDDFAISCGNKEFQELLEAFLGFTGHEGYVRVVSKDGKSLSCTRTILNPPVPLTKRDLDVLRSKNYFFRDIHLEDVSESGIRICFYPLFYESNFLGYLEVGASLEKIQKMKKSLIYLFAIIIPITFFISNLGGFFIFNRGLQSIIFLSRELKNFTAHELYKRVPVPNSKDEIRELFESINTMMASLEKSFEQIRQFSADASHELRTPLTIIKGEIEVALRSERTVEEYQDTLVSILEEIDRMSRIVEDLLLIAKADAKEVIIEKKRIKLNNILNELCEQLSIFAEAKNVELHYDNLPEVEINADPLRLRQVFTNIIENAIKYNVNNGKVFVSIEEDEHNYIVKVKDTGIGIRKEDIGKIFDRFYRADKSRKREIGGAGLGLSICKWIIESHGGYIKVESEYGKGSTFSIYLPKLIV